METSAQAIQAAIARDRRAARINELYQRCHARFIQTAYAFRLANDRLAPMAFDDPARKPLADVPDRASRAMTILHARSFALARAYVATVIPHEVRNA